MLPDWIQRWMLRGNGSAPTGPEAGAPAASDLERRVATLERQLVGLRWLALVSTLVLLVLLNELLSPLDLLRDALGAVAQWLVLLGFFALAGYGLWRWRRPRLSAVRPSPNAPPRA